MYKEEVELYHKTGEESIHAIVSFDSDDAPTIEVLTYFGKFLHGDGLVIHPADLDSTILCIIYEKAIMQRERTFSPEDV